MKYSLGEEGGPPFAMKLQRMGHTISLLLRLFCDAETDEGYDSPWMGSVGGDQGRGCGVGGELRSGSGEKMRGDAVVAVVADGVGGDVADGGFGEVGWEGGAGWEGEFVGGAGVFDARP